MHINYFFDKNINMKIIYKTKPILNYIFVLMFISIISIYSAGNLLGKPDLVIKQICWYIIGFFIMFIISNINIKKIYKNYKYLYIIGNIILLILLLFGKPINNSRCWFNIFGISFQPSEFMKIILIITNAVIINKSKKDYKLILKILFITLIPSILTFLEPDTGMVIIYFIISFLMLYISNIDNKYFTITFLFLLLFLSIFLSIYFYDSNTFIKIFGTNFFYRIDRLLDWKNGSGMQLTNAITSIGSAHILGFGFNNTPIYFPEAQTDFIFSVYATNYGFLGIIILLILLLSFDTYLIKIAIKTKNTISKYIITGIIGMLIYQQIQNIGMNIGLLPITGITLPFISYGGSSLISYMISIGLILNIEKKYKY